MFEIKYLDGIGGLREIVNMYLMRYRQKKQLFT